MPCAAIQQAATPQAEMGLLDLPSDWLRMLLKELDRDRERSLRDTVTRSHLLSLLSTCKTLRDLFLVEHSCLGLRFDEDSLPRYQSTAQTSLLLACKHAKTVRLQLRGTRGSAGWRRAGGGGGGELEEEWRNNGGRSAYDNTQLAKDVTISAASLMYLTNAAAGQGLAAIKSVDLQRLVLDALVPTWLTLTCPHMTSLLLDQCVFTGLPDPTTTTTTTTTIPTCGRLSQLTLYYCKPDVKEQRVLDQWQHQMRALTGLRSLTLHLEMPRRVIECCSVVGSQLTSLTFHANQCELLPLTPQFASWYPRVVELDLSWALVVRDADMEVLLGMTTLRRLLCGDFNLSHSYSDRDCPWTHLGVSTLNLAHLLHLPLDNVQSFQVVAGSRCGSLDIYPSADLATTQRAVAAIQKCGGIEWVKLARADITLDNHRSNADAECIAAMLPIFATCPPVDLIRFYNIPVDAKVLAALGKVLAGLSVSWIRLLSWGFGNNPGCVFDPEALPMVLPSLPPSVQGLCVSDCDLNETELTLMCVPACRPIEVLVDRNNSEDTTDRWGEGWEGRAQAAMTAAGHQHVTLSMTI